MTSQPAVSELRRARSIVTVEWHNRRFLVTIERRRIRRFTLSLDEAEALIEQLCEQLGCHPGGGANLATQFALARFLPII